MFSKLLSFFMIGVLLIPFAFASPLEDASMVEYRSLIPKDTCVCPYDPDIPQGWLECVAECAQHEKRMHLSSRDLSHLTRQVCICPEDEPNCPCPLIPPPDCCYTNNYKRDLTNVIPALHAKTCPPEGEQVCHEVDGKIECIPCIEERIICPVYNIAERASSSDATRCLATLDGKIRCPPCPPPCPFCPIEESKRAVEDSSSASIWCPPCNPPHPPNCPGCWYNEFGTIVCPVCPWPPVPTSTKTKTPKPTPTFCPLSKKYCIAYANGTYFCPGCGPVPITAEVTDFDPVEPTLAPSAQ